MVALKQVADYLKELSCALLLSKLQQTTKSQKILNLCDWVFSQIPNSKRKRYNIYFSPEKKIQ